MLWPYCMIWQICAFGAANSSEMCSYIEEALCVLHVMHIITCRSSPYYRSPYSGGLNFKSRTRDRVSGLKFS
jgi:hypothetical protein